MHATCERCGTSTRRVAYSYRLEAGVCWGCYHASFTPQELVGADRVERQHTIAATIRGALGDVTAGRRRGLADRATLIDAAGSVDDVLGLLDEVERLGVRVEGRP